MESSPRSSEPVGLGERLLWWLPACLGALTILGTTWPPMLDWPLHMAQGSLLAHWGDAGFVPAGVYCKAPFGSYQLFHYLLAGLHLAFGPDGMSPAALLLLFALYLGACALLLRAYQADRRLIAFAVPAFFGYHYTMGFGPFLFGVPGFFCSLALAQIWSRRGHWKWGVALTASLVLTYLCHPLPFALALVALGIRWWVQWLWQPQRRWPTFAALVLPGLLALYHSVSSQTFAAGRRAWWKHLMQLHPQLHWQQHEPSFFYKLTRLPLFLLGGPQMAWHDALLAVLLVLLLLLLAGAAFAARAERSFPDTAGLWLVALVPLGFYFALGQQVDFVNFVYMRFGFFSFVLLWALIPPQNGPRWREMLLYAGLALCLTHGATNAYYHYAWSKEVQGLRQVIQKIPKNSKVLGLLTHYRSATGIVQTYRGGEVRLSFAYVRHMSILDCQPLRQAHTWKYSRRPWEFRPHPSRPRWDFLLLYMSGNRAQQLRRFPWLFDPKSSYRPAFVSGRWLLAQKRRP